MKRSSGKPFGCTEIEPTSPGRLLTEALCLAVTEKEDPVMASTEEKAAVTAPEEPPAPPPVEKVPEPPKDEPEESLPAPSKEEEAKPEVDEPLEDKEEAKVAPEVDDKPEPPAGDPEDKPASSTLPAAVEPAAKEAAPAEPVTEQKVDSSSVWLPTAAAKTEGS